MSDSGEKSSNAENSSKKANDSRKRVNLSVKNEQPASKSKSVIEPIIEFDEETKQAIRKALQIQRLNILETLNGPSERCVICLESIDDGSLAILPICGHKFHEDCIEAHGHVSIECPGCE